jgi:putative toxin-antitoxin system antitoxin component (TIGR02293 family)
VIAFAEVTDPFGVGKPGNAIESPLRLVDLIEKALPLKALDRLCARIAPSDTTFKYRIVPKATLAGASYGVRLNAAQRTRIARLAAIRAQIRKVWGSDQEARDFLFRPHQLLAGRRPIDVAIGTELGGELVRDLLGRLEHGATV